MLWTKLGFIAEMDSRTPSDPGMGRCGGLGGSPKEKGGSDLSELGSLHRGCFLLCLLHRHRLGQDKYDGLGREYLMKDIVPPKAGQMEMLKRAAESESGLICQIGG